MGRKVNIGVMGCANIAVKSMIPVILAQHHLYRLAGIAGRDERKAEQYAASFGTKAFSDYEALLDTAGLDAVYIPLPNSLHAAWIERALDKGLHVLVEKPLACHHDEVVELHKKACTKDLALVENFQFRFHKQLAVIREMLDGGIIGELRCMRSSFGFPAFPDPENIRYQKDLGGGALLDAGVYPIRLSQIILGADLEVKAASSEVDGRKGVDMQGGGFLQQKSGPLFSQIAFGFDHFYQCNLELWGGRGKLTTNRIFTAPPGFEPEALLETAEGKEIIKLPADNHYENMLAHFYKTMQNPELARQEYNGNINHSRLVQEFKRKAHE